MHSYMTAYMYTIRLVLLIHSFSTHGFDSIWVLTLHLGSIKDLPDATGSNMPSSHALKVLESSSWDSIIHIYQYPRGLGKDTLWTPMANFMCLATVNESKWLLKAYSHISKVVWEVSLSLIRMFSMYEWPKFERSGFCDVVWLHMLCLCSPSARMMLLRLLHW